MKLMSDRLGFVSSMIQNASREFDAASRQGEDENFEFLPEMDELRISLSDLHLKVDLLLIRTKGKEK